MQRDQHKVSHALPPPAAAAPFPNRGSLGGNAIAGTDSKPAGKAQAGGPASGSTVAALFAKAVSASAAAATSGDGVAAVQPGSTINVATANGKGSVDGNRRAAAQRAVVESRQDSDDDVDFTMMEKAEPSVTSGAAAIGSEAVASAHLADSELHAPTAPVTALSRDGDASQKRGNAGSDILDDDDDDVDEKEDDGKNNDEDEDRNDAEMGEASADAVVSAPVKKPRKARDPAAPSAARKRKGAASGKTAYSEGFAAPEGSGEAHDAEVAAAAPTPAFAPESRAFDAFRIPEGAPVPPRQAPKVLRTVTFVDDRGYMVTEEVWEDAPPGTVDESPHEKPAAAPTPRLPPKVAATTSSASKARGKPAASGDKSGKQQQQLTSFFKK